MPTFVRFALALLATATLAPDADAQFRVIRPGLFRPGPTYFWSARQSSHDDVQIE